VPDYGQRCQRCGAHRICLCEGIKTILEYVPRLRVYSTLFLLLGVLPGAAVPAQTASDNADGRILKAPFSAQRRFTSVEKLADGTTRRSESGGSKARDSLGRTYSADERHWTYLDKGKSVLGSEMLYRIDDPMANTETRWDSTTKEVKVIHWPKSATGGAACSLCDSFSADVPGTVVEKLGVRTIEGVVAEGKRSTYKITEAQDQNGQALSVVHESWYCAELKIVVLETNDDPRSGTTRDELVGIVRREPDVAKYRPPTNYVVHDVRLPAQ
jgi:hypothetical protein